MGKVGLFYKGLEVLPQNVLPSLSHSPVNHTVAEQSALRIISAQWLNNMVTTPTMTQSINKAKSNKEGNKERLAGKPVCCGMVKIVSVVESV